MNCLPFEELAMPQGLAKIPTSTWVTPKSWGGFPFFSWLVGGFQWAIPSLPTRTHGSSGCPWLVLASKPRRCKDVLQGHRGPISDLAGGGGEFGIPVQRGEEKDSANLRGEFGSAKKT